MLLMKLMIMLMRKRLPIPSKQKLMQTTKLQLKLRLPLKKLHIVHMMVSFTNHLVITQRDTFLMDKDQIKD